METRWQDVGRRFPAGLIMELFRNHPTCPMMHYFAENASLSATDILQLLAEDDQFCAPHIGTTDVSRSTCTKRLADAHTDRLIRRLDGSAARGAHARYEITPLGTGLVDSVAAIRTYGLTHWDGVVRATRLRNGLPADVDLPPAPSAEDPRAQRLAARMALGMLESRWNYGCLVWLGAYGPLSTIEMSLQINASLGSIPAFDYRRLGTSQQYRCRDELLLYGLINWVEPGGHSSDHLLDVTPLGRGLLDGMWETIPWSQSNLTTLWEMVQRRQGWPEPWHNGDADDTATS